MLERIRTVFDRMTTRSAAEAPDAWPYAPPPGTDERSIDEPATTAIDAVPPTDLFRCPSCDRVYVATDKRTCSTCNTTVEDVEPTDHTALSGPRR